MPHKSYKRSQALYLAACNLIPGGVHRGGVPLLDGGAAPLYFERGEGCRIWDVDGNEYIDYILAYGAILLGYAQPDVDRAAFEQIARGKLLTLNHPLHLQFVDAVLRRFPAADMAYMMKTGSEATTAAVRIARCFTGRRKIIRCGFHGWHDWCFPSDPSVPFGLEDQVLELKDVSAAGLSVCFRAHPAEIAGVIIAPEMVLPLSRDRMESLMETAHAHGALFILDEVKTGFRTAGGSVQQYLDIRPDLTALSKALGNGWPVAAVTGRREVMEAGQRTHLSATFHGETAGMAAALMTLDIIDREDVQAHVWRLGERLIDGLNSLIALHAVPARAYGEPLPPMPFLSFTHTEETMNAVLRTSFYSEMYERGILLHPRHLWYISHSHSVADIDRTLAAADEALGIAMRNLS